MVEAVDQAGPDDVAAAVAAARAAFDDPRGWRATPVAERAGVLRRVADLLQRDREHIARVETLDTGKTLGESRIDIDDVTAVFRYYADIAVAQEGRTVDVGQPHVLSRIAHEPVGVCALITPWNYPLLQLSWKLAPALVAGCTCVIKPSEVTPLTSVLLVRLVEEAGVPPGVVNILLGTGPAVGAPLTAHPDVDMVSFTGGLATGQAIIRASAETVKRVAVELGGKNPNIVFADAADNGGSRPSSTTPSPPSSCTPGQVCSAGARLIVEESVADELVAELATRADAIRIGNGLDPASQTGPLVSAAHRAKIEDFVASARAEGARVLAGGCRPDDPELAKGYFYRPTVLDGCHRGMRVVREETFGPLLTVERFVDRGRGDRAGQRHDLRPGGRGLDARRGARAPGGRGAAPRHGVDQRLRPVRAGRRVGRHEALRQRPRARPHRAARVPGAEAHLAQHRARPGPLVHLSLDRGWR